MDPFVQLLIFAGLLCVPLGVNLCAARDDYQGFVDALFASGMLAAIWAFTNIVGALWAFPESKQFHSLVDLIGLSVAVVAYMTQRQRWKLILAFLFLGQLVAHAAFWGAVVIWHISPDDLKWRYIATLNVLWYPQLVCVGWSGGVHCAIRARDRLRRSGRLPHLVRH